MKRDLGSLPGTRGQGSRINFVGVRDAVGKHLPFPLVVGPGGAVRREGLVCSLHPSRSAFLLWHNRRRLPTIVYRTQLPH